MAVILRRADRQPKPKRILRPYAEIPYSPPDDLAMWPRKPDPEGPLTVNIGDHVETNVYVNYPQARKKFRSILDFSGGAHFLVNGATGSGKTRLVSHILIELAAKGAALVILDPAKSGTDFMAFSDHAHIAYFAENIEPTLMGLSKIWDERTEMKRGQTGPWDTANGPYIVVMVDEAPSLWEIGISPLALEVVTKIARLGRSHGFVLGMLTQKATLDTSIPSMVRANLGTRILLQTTDPTARSVVIGDVPAWSKEEPQLWDTGSWAVPERRFLMVRAETTTPVTGRLLLLPDGYVERACEGLPPKHHFPALDYVHTDTPRTMEERIMDVFYRHYSGDENEETAIIGHLKSLLGWSTDTLVYLLYELVAQGRLERDGSKFKLPSQAPAPAPERTQLQQRMEANANLNMTWRTLDTRPERTFYLSIRGALLDGQLGISKIAGHVLSVKASRIVGLPEGTPLPKNKAAIQRALDHLEAEKLVKKVGSQYALPSPPLHPEMVQ